MKIYEAWQELYEWLDTHPGYPYDDFTPLEVLNKMDELEAKHE